MKSLSEENKEYEIRGPSERCPVRTQASIEGSQFGWHWCNLKIGHPGPHQCVHGEFPPEARLYEQDHQQRLTPVKG